MIFLLLLATQQAGETPAVFDREREAPRSYAEVNLRLIDIFDEEGEHPHYAQPGVVSQPTSTGGLSWSSECWWIDRRREPGSPLIPRFNDGSDQEVPPDQEEPPYAWEPPPGSRPGPRASGIEFFDSFDLELGGVTPSAKSQFPATLGVSISFTAPNGEPVQIEDLDAGYLNGFDFAADLTLARFFVRYDEGSAESTATALPGGGFGKPGAVSSAERFAGGGGGGGADTIEVEWELRIWEIGIERDIVVARFDPVSFDLFLVAAYYRAEADPTDAVLVSGGISTEFDPGTSTFSGAMFGTGLRVDVILGDEARITATIQYLEFVGDLDAGVVQATLGITYTF